MIVIPYLGVVCVDGILAQWLAYRVVPGHVSQPEDWSTVDVGSLEPGQMGWRSDTCCRDAAAWTGKPARSHPPPDDAKIG
jgi:hypothetical protein